jgi:hypothetical protein
MTGQECEWGLHIAGNPRIAALLGVIDVPLTVVFIALLASIACILGVS